MKQLVEWVKGTNSAVWVLVIALLDLGLLSWGHVYGSFPLLWGAIALFCWLVILADKRHFLPLILFFLPWTNVMRAEPSDSSFTTLILPVVFIMTAIRWLKNGRIIRGYIAFALLLFTYTLAVKLLNNLPFHNAYLVFMMMLFYVPIYMSEYKQVISFEECIAFLVGGVLTACIASKILIANPNMLPFINVLVYDEELYYFTRFTGFNGDPNFYGAQILVAIAGLILLISRMKRKMLMVLTLFCIVVLIYFGIQSISKMFALLLFSIIGLWSVALLIDKRGISYKLLTIALMVVAAGTVISGNLFSEQINNYLIRFGISISGDAVTFTTGRTYYSSVYLNHLFSHPERLLFGIGLSKDQLRLLLDTNNAHMTLIEITYQLGIIGGSLLFLWWISVYRETIITAKMYLPEKLYFLIMLAAVILPWFALDVLYFDEFFYFTVLLFLAKNYLSVATNKQLVNQMLGS